MSVVTRRYPASVRRVVDGDTVDLDLDLGFGVRKRIRMRLAGIDTDEIHGVSPESEEYQRGIRQKIFVHRLLSEGSAITFVSHEETGKYGRPIGDIEVGGKLLSESLFEAFGYLEEGYGESW
jgi:micrococcal nuclease